MAEIVNADIANGADDAMALQDVAPLDKAGPGDLSFLDNLRYKDQFKDTKAAACIVSPDLQNEAPEGVALLLTPNPYKAYALAAQAFYPDSKPEPHIAASAHVHESAKLGKGCTVEYGAVIGEGVEIGENTWIESNAVIGANVKMGRACRVGAHSSVTHSLIGDHVRLYPGCRIGQDGFGFAIDPEGHVKVPQLGRVVIEDSVEIGANTTIDRGSGPDTIIGQGTWIDNLVQIGHNVKIGKGCVIVSQAGVSGSSVLEDYVVLGGQVGIAGHLHVGKGAKLAAKAGVMRNVPAGAELVGSPAIPIKQFMRQIATLNRLIKKEKK